MDRDILYAIKNVVYDLCESFGNTTLEQEFKVSNYNVKVKIEIDEDD